jgi:spermidine/putrescine transport system permease protein
MSNTLYDSDLQLWIEQKFSLLPQLMSGIISGCLLAFVLSLDDFLIASFTAGSGTNTLPMEIFSRIRTGVKPDINALSVMLISMTAIVALIGELIRNLSLD